MRFNTESEKETYQLGKKIARDLQGGEVLILSGELGAGKTILVKGLAAGLGVKDVVTSPTFVIMKVYHLGGANVGIRDLAHIDCYRVGEPEAIADIGAVEYFNRSDAVTVIEWGERIKEILPKKIKKINIKILKNNLRQITIL